LGLFNATFARILTAELPAKFTAGEIRCNIDILLQSNFQIT
jgi:hypothetical protein